MSGFGGTGCGYFEGSGADVFRGDRRLWFGSRSLGLSRSSSVLGLEESWFLSEPWLKARAWGDSYRRDMVASECYLVALRLATNSCGS